ncbi:DUF2335 domain-containing protein [Tenacibaculum finnmarkense]|uniref:DUF2335 domain-containing protein n=1 Tax=Tenacibaculum finnmarkense TaxID=2781243 RepID=UPI00187B5D89|nr:DUF2335 domain-containing protein [Tenacibaculum finnmarkense]MBE7689064.1 DUF2335 domain-containing protein [Tenacibaculum finnmarkense genomovar ulcerans]MCD8423645.1 DUF2335 domain-containing protein [Tenacibaculum finnmarkense genomovar ulcerans]MCG8236886.1 DUF2335 domain-containing protein [Tenacibaculum finnmarkense genomovar ulcerans]MCG8239829.1 DUF2335 domain-containing protein [Tenacibaculum finnmarkense genomovar ulcerans]MCG8831392.1 DUF2335 domain-containing protein [Tenacibac
MSSKNARARKVSNNKESVEEVTLYQGPIPQYEDLVKYNELIPNGAERFMVMAEQERIDRNKLKNRELDRDENYINKEHKGKIISLIISLVIIISFLGLCAYGFMLGYPTQSASILGACLLGIIGYVTRQKKSTK